jgi:asparagine synthase (glutamine-hydrolysing)
VCGLVGIAWRSVEPQAAAADRLAAAVASLRHRGPDQQGQWRDRSVALGHTRLSILDLSDAGRQPMRTADGRHTIVYNGEVYNFRELAAQYTLDGLGSSSDTEVVLRLGAALGEAAFAKLNGMFAFAMYDAHQRRLWLVRDRLGIKPLYFAVRPDYLVFASEIKAILTLEQRRLECDLTALHEWTYFGNPLGGRTLYRGIHQLLPGHCLQLNLASFEHSCWPYWQLRKAIDATGAAESVAEAVATTRRALEQAVRRQLVSDVPVGVFLSGGIDSSAVTAFASRHYGGRLATYSAGFDFAAGASDELPKARRVAAHFGTAHHELRISGGDVGDLIERLVDSHDMPFADAANIPLALMAREIRAHTKVVLQGDGGDELFAGYGRYFTVSHYRLLRALSAAAKLVLRPLRKSAYHYRALRYANAISADNMAATMALLLTPEDRSMHPAAIFARPLRQAIEESDPFARHRECLDWFAAQDRVNQMSFIDLLITLPDTFLEKVDRATMMASLEVRVPFLDHELVELVTRLPGHVKAPHGKPKWLLKQALAGVVPDEVVRGPKVGLTVPYREWLQGPLKPMFFDHLYTFSGMNPGVLDVSHVEDLFKRTAEGVCDSSFMLWKVLNLAIWGQHRGVTFGVREAAQ